MPLRTSNTKYYLVKFNLVFTLNYDCTFSDVQVEKVAIKDGLNNTRNDGNPILEALGVVAVDPVKDVEETVRSERKQVVGSD